MGTDRITAASVPALRPPEAEASISAQKRLLEQWLTSDTAMLYASRLVRRRNPGLSPSDLIGEAWLRIDAMALRRVEPMHTMDSPTDAARYMARTLDNVSRDFARRETRRRTLIDTLKTTAVEIGADDPSHHSTALLLQLITAIGDRARLGISCSGCHAALVAASAMETIHLILESHAAGARGQSFDDLLNDALDRMAAHLSTDPSARRQRKARCGPCVADLIKDGLADMGIAA